MPSVQLPGDDNHPRVRWGKWKKRTGKNLSFKKWKKREEKMKKIREENKRRKKGLKRRGNKGKVESMKSRSAQVQDKFFDNYSVE